MENNIAPNVAVIKKIDPENCKYLLLKVSVSEDDDGKRSWEILESRKDLYDFIKEDLEENDEPININESFIIPEFLTFNDATPIYSFVIACKNEYDDDFDFESFRINK